MHAVHTISTLSDNGLVIAMISAFTFSVVGSTVGDVEGMFVGGTDVFFVEIDGVVDEFVVH